VRTSGIGRSGSAGGAFGGLLRKTVDRADVQGLQRMSPPPVDHIGSRRQGLIHAGNTVLQQPALQSSQRQAQAYRQQR